MALCSAGSAHIFCCFFPELCKEASKAGLRLHQTEIRSTRSRNHPKHSVTMVLHVSFCAVGAGFAIMEIRSQLGNLDIFLRRFQVARPFRHRSTRKEVGCLTCLAKVWFRSKRCCPRGSLYLFARSVTLHCSRTCIERLFGTIGCGREPKDVERCERSHLSSFVRCYAGCSATLCL